MGLERLRVLSREEIERIHGLSLEILEDVGVKVELKKLREMLSDVGCEVDEAGQRVKFKRGIVEEYVAKAPREFTICGPNGENEIVLSPDTRVYGGLGTQINQYDLRTGEFRETTLQDTIDHMVLFEYLDHIYGNQMDVWPHDIPMHTIHVQAIRAWARNCTKSFGMGAYGVMATTDMMNMVEMIAGGSDNIQNRHPFLTIVSIQSPLSSSQMQLEGLVILAERNQPALVSPEAMAGTTAPVTLAGLLVQHNAEVLSHIVMTQVVNPGAPVVYGSVSTIAEMRRGTVALGAPETGLISAASSQMAHHYGVPCRAVAGATESKTMDIQCGVERQRSMLMAAMGGANYITCVGTTESTLAGAHEMAVMDDEIIGGVERILRGIDVNDESLALDVIRAVGPDGNYLMQEHTQLNFRSEHFIPKLADRDKRDIWENGGRRDMVSRAREKAEKLLADHREKELAPKLSAELNKYVESVAARSLDDFYAAEWDA